MHIDKEGILASYIAVPRDLTNVKSKFIFNLTKRQLVCFSLAALIGVPSFFLLKKVGDTSFAAMGMMVLMMPLFFVGMYQKNGQPLEVTMSHFIQANFIRPKVRVYKTKNYYDLLHKKALAEEEVEKIVRSHKKDINENRIKEKRRKDPDDTGRPEHRR